MNSIRETVWPLLYPLKMPDRKRDRPMQVLALGLSRSGTDSLRNALCDLGYAEIYHAFYMQESQGNDGIFWTPLIRQKLRGEAVPTDAAFWDRVLGQCQGVTDFPCCLFYKELMQAYPHAHIIVNVRALDPWYASIVEACMPIFRSWPLYVLHFFDAELFWMTPSFYLFIRDWFEGSLQKNGKRVAQAHYAGLEAYCKEQGREYLTWDVTEGWAPVCKLLGKPIPDEPFPRGNARGAENKERVRSLLEERFARATKNLLIVAALVSAPLMGLGARALYVRYR